jgi:hypothetical protein
MMLDPAYAMKMAPTDLSYLVKAVVDDSTPMTRMKARVERECHRRTAHNNKHIYSAWVARRWQEKKREIEVQLYKLTALGKAEK